jgi:3-phenylpropionate/trans-cinnamate dioxygenase ferredoxin component
VVAAINTETVAFQKLARAEEIPPGKTKYLCAGVKPIVLANFEGRIYALAGLCPHQGNPLDGAKLWENLIDCPWHHFQYDVRTGENFFPKNVYPSGYQRLQAHLHPLKTYDVEVRDGEVWVDLN